MAAIVACTSASGGHPTLDESLTKGYIRPTTTAFPPSQSDGRAGVPTREAATANVSAPTPDPLVALASVDTAKRTATGRVEIRVVRVEAYDRPDRSPGCPRPGLGYAHPIMARFQIVADADDVRLEYHTDQTEFVWCSSQLAPA
jgi:hypothetical protein